MDAFEWSWFNEKNLKNKVKEERNKGEEEVKKSAKSKKKRKKTRKIRLILFVKYNNLVGIYELLVKCAVDLKLPNKILRLLNSVDSEYLIENSDRGASRLKVR